LQQQGIGAERLHIMANIQQHRNGAKGTHDATDAQRVADGLL
jgi:hypothetical protein